MSKYLFIGKPQGFCSDCFDVQSHLKICYLPLSKSLSIGKQQSFFQRHCLNVQFHLEVFHLPMSDGLFIGNQQSFWRYCVDVKSHLKICSCLCLKVYLQANNDASEDTVNVQSHLNICCVPIPESLLTCKQQSFWKLCVDVQCHYLPMSNVQKYINKQTTMLLKKLC